MRLSRELRRVANPIWRDILRHPFLMELRDGTLSKESFKFFLAQDYIFLKDMTRCLALALTKSSDEEATRLLSEMHASSTGVELEAIRRLGERVGITSFEGLSYAPACYAYTRHLLCTTLSGSFAEILSSITPCYWSYKEIGDHFEGSADPVYDEWVKTYTSEGYARLVSRILGVLDRIGITATKGEKERTGAVFLTSSEYELMFWDMAYRREGWRNP